MKSGTSTAGTKTVFVSRTRMILIFPRFSGSWIFSGFGVSHFALSWWLTPPRRDMSPSWHLDRHHGDEMNEEKGTRCNELKVLASILFRSKYGREVMRPTDKTMRANHRHLDRWSAGDECTRPGHMTVASAWRTTCGVLLKGVLKSIKSVGLNALKYLNMECA